MTAGTMVYRFPVLTGPGGVEHALAHSRERIVTLCRETYGPNASPSLSWHVTAGLPDVRLALEAALEDPHAPGVAYANLGTELQMRATWDQLDAHIRHLGEASILVVAIAAFTVEEAGP